VDTASDGNRPLAPAAPEPIYGVGAVPQDHIPPILLFGAGALRDHGAEVRIFDEETVMLAQRMAAAMLRANGVGLAAPQVGVPAQVVVVSGDATNGTTLGYPVAFMNPVILEQSPETTLQLEGCLSFPRITVKIARPNWVRVRAQGLSGRGFEVRAEGLYARVLCHEIEHLDGKLLIDHAKSFKASQMKAKMAKYRKRLRARIEAAQ
jgi:peptide deformylase